MLDALPVVSLAEECKLALAGSSFAQYQAE